MIMNVRNKRPIISFDLGSLKKDVFVGRTTRIYLNGMFRPDTYTAALKPFATITIVKINDTTFEVTPATPGTYSFRLGLINSATSQTFESNLLTLTAV
jgi:hypothetical protein